VRKYRRAKCQQAPQHESQLRWQALTGDAMGPAVGAQLGRDDFVYLRQHQKDLMIMPLGTGNQGEIRGCTGLWLRRMHVATQCQYTNIRSAEW